MPPPNPTLKALFDRARDLPTPEERVAFLDQACPDPALRRDVERLLRADASLDGQEFLERPAAGLQAVLAGSPDTPGSTSQDSDRTDHHDRRPDPVLDALAIGDRVGTMLGPYKLLKVLGRGGMGVVYLAEQEKPLRRQVALKVIRPGKADEAFVARFAAERQALTRMSHPNIARVFDAGDLAGGSFYVMELVVDGVPLAEFCDRRRLAVRDRLGLFVQVCEAVQHAHQKGVLHRDLKPSNVLGHEADGAAAVKVIDFGLAKAIEGPLTDDPAEAFLEGRMIGTLPYMSPEQATAAEVDTRTDVYSLGAILYELLTGTVPLRPKAGEDSPEEWQRLIVEEVPRRPSERVEGRQGRALRGELDWITLKALEKDRDQRYAMPVDLARDVRCYLAGDPVEAGPQPRGYRLRKLARKHWAALAVATAFLALLVTGVVGLSVALARESELRGQAVDAERVTRDGFDLATASVDASIRNNTVFRDQEKTLLRKAISRLRDRPTVKSRTLAARATIAQGHLLSANMSYLIGDREKAERQYAIAIKTYEALTAEYPREAELYYEAARAQSAYAIYLLGISKPEEAARMLLTTRSLQEYLVKTFPADEDKWRVMADEQNNLGVAFRVRGNLRLAEVSLRTAISLGEKLAAGSPDNIEYQINLAASYHNLGNIVRDQGIAADSLPWYGKAVALLAGLKPLPEDGSVFLRNAYYDRANALGQLGRHAEAIADWENAIRLSAKPTSDHLKYFQAVAREEVKLKAESKPARQQLYSLAVLCATAVDPATKEDEESLVRHYRNRALALLQQAAAAGLFDDATRFKQLVGEKAFLTGLPRADLEAFVKGLKRPPTSDGAKK